MIYYDPKISDKFSVYGLNWFSKDKRYDRLPVYFDETIAKVSENVNFLKHSTSGVHVAFFSNTKNISIKASLSYYQNMYHMAFCGQEGFDLYAGDDVKSLKFLNTSYKSIMDKTYDYKLLDNKDVGYKLFVIYFPLYSGVEEFSVGIDDDAEIQPAEGIYDKKKIVFYGTSITQGACSIRPGLAYTNSLSRRFGKEVLNFGFSGSGKGEKEMAEVISTVSDTELFVLEYEANVELSELKSTLNPFIDILREKYPDTPVIVASKTWFTRELTFESERKKQQRFVDFQKKTVKERKAKGENIYFYNGHKLFGKYPEEALVDGIHPNDIGVLMITENYEKLIKSLL